MGYPSVHGSVARLTPPFVCFSRSQALSSHRDKKNHGFLEIWIALELVGKAFSYAMTVVLGLFFHIFSSLINISSSPYYLP